MTILASIACALIWMALAAQKPWFAVACVAYFIIIYFCHQSFVTYGVGAIKYIDPEYKIDDGMLFASAFKTLYRGMSPVYGDEVDEL